jgi:hypothetical protein
MMSGVRRTGLWFSQLFPEPRIGDQVLTACILVHIFQASGHLKKTEKVISNHLRALREVSGKKVNPYRRIDFP